MEPDGKGKIVVKYNPKDAESVERVGRLIGRRTRSLESPKQIEAEVRRLLGEDSGKPVQRDAATALGMPPPPKDPPRGSRLGDPFPEDPRRGIFAGWHGVEDPLPPQILKRFANVRPQDPEPIIVIDRGNNVFRVYDVATNETFEAFTLEGAVDAVRRRLQNAPETAPPRVVYCVDFEPIQAEGFAATLRLRALAGNRGQRVDVVVHAPGLNAGQIDAAMRRPFDFTKRSPAEVTVVGGNLTLTTIVPSAAPKGSSVKMTRYVFSQKPLVEQVHKRVVDAHDRAVGQVFPQNSDVAPERLTRFHQRFFTELQRIADDTGEPIDGLMHDVRLESLNIQIGRKETTNDPQQSSIR